MLSSASTGELSVDFQMGQTVHRNLYEKIFMIVINHHFCKLNMTKSLASIVSNLLLIVQLWF